ncbi:exodeoxyribonuclease V subunit alpha [Nocardioides sp. Soil796]|uniref:exodeoxyribonuclease V subunit alpha n=1 Tax=Nocardioides sp. Soil796 TaxID=1736412 RepID=UPI00070FEED0|nr:exodeoxyribonuclease V subunit alpha [Nocardioides sp. Soil796]KRF11845.1 exodeoxyribonuclease V subunit alpha [Nocardioides sp. Soil796]
MTTSDLVDGYDRHLARRSDGLLRAFNDAGVLTAADVHVANRLGALGGEPDETVLLAVALVTRAVRHGSVCLAPADAAEIDPELDWPDVTAWVAAIEASPLVAADVLHWEFGLLHLDRYWRQEVQVCDDLVARRALPAPVVDEPALTAALGRVFPDSGYAEQAAAVDRAARQWTTVLTGGPGTGKTTTVAGLLAVLIEQAESNGQQVRIAMAAPTGKAAARLQESVQAETAKLPAEDRARLAGLTSSTLHRLLGSRHDNGTRFRHHRANRLPHDIVVVDETSMVSLTMMARLLEAVRPEARLVLVGDRDQLASVDAGAVLNDLVLGLPDDGTVIALRDNHRSTEQIIRLAEALRDGRDDDAVAALQAGSDSGFDSGSGSGEVEFVTAEDPASALRATITDAALAVRRHAEAGDAEAALTALDEHRLLCAHREGPYGVRHWNRQVEAWLSEVTGDPLYDTWYVGRPVLVTANDYGLGVHNGDTGVVIRRASDGALRVVLRGAEGLLDFAPSRLDAVETMHAMTIHKAQGSQATVVTVLLPDEESRLLTRELFYTAVTRAKEKVVVVGSEAAVRLGVARRAVRPSGLQQRLRAADPGVDL